MRCQICREKVSRNAFRWWRQDHYLSVHPEYAKWIGQWMRNFLAIDFIFVVTMIVAEYLWFSGGGLYGIVAGVVILSFLGSVSTKGTLCAGPVGGLVENGARVIRRLNSLIVRLGFSFRVASR